MSPYVRTVRTASGATAVQIVYSSRRGARDIEYIGSAHEDADLEVLRAVARQRLAAGQDELDLGLAGAEPAKQTAGGPLPITSSRMGHLWDALMHAYQVLGFEQAAGGDDVFGQLVLARIIEPTSKLDSLRVLEETGVSPPSYATVKRHLPVFAKESWRQRLAAACAARAGLGPASLVLYDVSTLYFETDAGDGFREPGFSKERRLEPQIVADAGMVSAANQKAIEAAGLSFILGARVPEVPYVVAAWRKAHPDTEIPDGQVFTQPWPAGPTDQRRDQVIYYQYRADRARRTLRGIDEQVAKAEKAVVGKAAVKRNRFVRPSGGTRTVNRALEAKARSLAGLKGYVTNPRSLPDGRPVTAEFVIDAYHRLFQFEKSFRMSKHDLQARPIYHHQRDSIEAHLTIVFAALAVSRWIEDRTGCSIKKFVRTARRYRTIEIQAGTHTIAAADPLPDDLRDALEAITRASRRAH